ncbi:MAG: class I SAM-dependent methyltransferase [Gemmatimonadaceae bacterium]
MTTTLAPTMTTCRACLGSDLFLYLPLGDHPPANAFLRPEALGKPEATFPLDTHVCLNCGLIQVPDTLPPDFFVDYVYMPSASDTMKRHFAAFAQRCKDTLITSKEQRVVDIGCNDGLFLGACKEAGLTTLGIDPSQNIAEFARAKGIEVFNEYFTSESAKRVLAQHGPAQVITTTNTFNHIDNLHGFMDGVRTLLAPDGTFVIEVPQALTCVEHNEFDTVYHEHLSVFSVASIAALGSFYGLQVVDIDELPIHGGSMRVYLRRAGPAKPIVADFLEREKKAGLFERETYVAHAKRVERIREELMELLHRLKAEGKRLAGYGAPAKGSTLLNYYGIGPDLIEYLADRNELKQGRFSPGTHIPVVSPSRIAETNPDYLLILAWNFADEIMEQQEAFRARGGKFILPIPEPRVVG